MKKTKKERAKEVITKIFPIVLIALDVAAAAVYAANGDAKKSCLLDRGCRSEYLCNILRGRHGRKRNKNKHRRGRIL